MSWARLPIFQSRSSQTAQQVNLSFAGQVSNMEEKNAEPYMVAQEMRQSVIASGLNSPKINYPASVLYDRFPSARSY